MSGKGSARLYDHPFSRAYWQDAAAEMKNTRMLIFAALMIALRVAMKAIRIPVGPYLDINTAFLVNALGAMTYGPVVAILAAAISDTLGCLLVPSGPYFFPFIFIEIAGSLIFALFLYRAKITVLRVLLARFSINFFVNLVLQTPVMMLYYQMVLGKSYAIFDLPRIIKNMALFPFEALVLVIFLRAAMPPLSRMGVMRSREDGLVFSRKGWIQLAALSLLGIGVFVGGSYYLHDQVSLSASYSAEERKEANLSCREMVLAKDPELQGREDIVAVVEAAYHPFLGKEDRWTVAVYEIVPEAKSENTGNGDAEAKVKTYEDFAGLSKSKAAENPGLHFLYRVRMVSDPAGQVVSWEKE